MKRNWEISSSYGHGQEIPHFLGKPHVRTGAKDISPVGNQLQTVMQRRHLMEDMTLKPQRRFGDLDDRKVLVAEKAGDARVFGQLVDPGAVNNTLNQLLFAPVDQHVQLARKNRLIADKARNDDPIAPTISQVAP